jgi:hypothetical protein
MFQHVVFEQNNGYSSYASKYISDNYMETYAKYDYLKRYHKYLLSSDIISNPVNNTKDILEIFNTVINKESNMSIANKRYKNLFINRYERAVFNKFISNIFPTEKEKSKSYFEDINTKSIGISNKKSLEIFAKSIKKIIDANNENKSKKGNIEDSIDAFDAFNIYKDMVMQRAIIKIAGSDISRNAAKNPVMVFIYGSSINSIKKLISNTAIGIFKTNNVVLTQITTRLHFNHL